MKKIPTTILLMLSVAVLGAQRSPDKITYKNQAFDVGVENYSSALEIYFEQNNISPPASGDDKSIDTLRAYIAQWEVRANSLYLVGIFQKDDFFSSTYNMGEVLSLPADTKDVKATWFTGTMRLEGKEGLVIYLSFDKGTLVDAADVIVTGSLGGTSETTEQKTALIEFAKSTFSEPIESIHLTTCWGHPLDRSVAIVGFKRKQLGGDYYESSRAFIYNQEYPPRLLKDASTWKPGPNDVVFGPWFTDKKMESYCIVKYTLRDHEIYLGPPDRRVSYNDIQRLLLSIEARDYAIAEPTRTVNEGGSVSVSIVDDTPPDLDAIRSIGIEERDGKLMYVVWTSDHQLSGNTYAFECHDEKFILVSAGFWMS